MASSQLFLMIIFALHLHSKCKQDMSLNVKNHDVLLIFHFGHHTIVSNIEQPILNCFL
jgi:hypothetical protein